MNDDSISRRAALNALEWKWAGKAAIDAIKDLPSVEPKIVRCQHCRHNDLPETSPNVLCRKFYGMGYYNGFCSWGERREDD